MTTPTKPVEQKARELLADAMSELGTEYDLSRASALRKGSPFVSIISTELAIRAIIAALNTDEERIRRLEEALERIEAMGFVNEGHGCALIAREALSTPSKGVG